jgi:hypothetical protein
MRHGQSDRTGLDTTAFSGRFASHDGRCAPASQVKIPLGEIQRQAGDLDQSVHLAIGNH